MRRTLLLLLFLAVFALRLAMLAQSSHACGIDGYYYVLQVESILAHGVPRIPDASPVLWFLAAVTALPGDTVTLLKIGAALLGALPLIPGFLIGRELAKHPVGGLFLTGLLGASVSLAYLSIELLRNLGALSLLLFTLYHLLRLEHGDRSRRRILSGALCLLLAAASHRSTAVLGLLWAAALAFRLLPFARKTKLLVLAGGAVAAGTALFLVRGLHPADLARFAGAFALGPVVPLFSAGLREVFPVTLLVETGLAFLLTYALLFFKRAGLPFTIKAVWLSLFLLFFPFWNLDGAGMGFRLALVGTPLAMVVAVAWATRVRRTGTVGRTVRVGMAVAATALLVLFPFSAYRPKTDPPYALYERLVRRIGLPRNSVLICHRGLNLYYSWASGNDGISFVPEAALPPERLWRLTAHVEWERLRDSLPEALVAGRLRRLGGPYSLVREDDWQIFLARLDPGEREAYLNPWNPFEQKPWFLRRQQGEFSRPR